MGQGLRILGARKHDGDRPCPNVVINWDLAVCEQLPKTVTNKVYSQPNFLFVQMSETFEAQTPETLVSFYSQSWVKSDLSVTPDSPLERRVAV